MTGYTELPSGIKVTYQGNVLRCGNARSPQENYERIQRALCELLDTTVESLFSRAYDGNPMYSLFEHNGGKIEFYRETG